MRRAVLVLGWVACGPGDGLYEPCDAPADCPAPEGAEPECLDKGDAGFCTWSCSNDEDCGFDDDPWARVCAAFEAEEGQHCFPSCREDGDGDGEGDGAVCPEGFTCRSTGGGNDNRRVCFPQAVEAEPE